jgi:hypothetical protein
MERAALARERASLGHHLEAAYLYREALMILYESDRVPHSSEAESTVVAETPREHPLQESLDPNLGSVANTVLKDQKAG